jgi:hypothetical protein
MALDGCRQARPARGYGTRPDKRGSASSAAAVADLYFEFRGGSWRGPKGAATRTRLGD